MQRNFQGKTVVITGHAGELGPGSLNASPAMAQIW